MNASMLKQAVYYLNDGLKQVGREVDAMEIVDIIQEHAVATALSAGASGAIAGVGGVIAMGIASASTIAMYGRLANAIGVRLGNGLIRALGSAVVADIAAAVTANLALSAAVSFIPGVGTMASVALTGITNFCFVYMAGVISLKLITALGVSRIETMSEAELKSAAKNIQSNMDIKAAMKEAKKVYKEVG